MDMTYNGQTFLVTNVHFKGVPTVTEGQQTNCQNNEFTDFIDYIVFDQPGIACVDRSSFAHVTFRQEDERVRNTISDHSPVLVAMWSP